MSDTPSLEYPKFNTNIKMTISKYSMNFLGNNYGVIHYDTFQIIIKAHMLVFQYIYNSALNPFRNII